ncbi:hypothetical protein Cgig2_022998 [Carnegiea gigantea]|uniref:Peptidase A2 domain-containing protein n=1 Tax=Carnegiea gigantea TaxID=171969 RepID=A0A9Q1JPY5_9CARY|nr:hypothetical protein Cgig2_022998 [Carnegiea gigantea]
MAARELKPLIGPTITFGLKDMHPLQTPHNDALIATAIVRRILVDTGSSIALLNALSWKEGGHRSNGSTFGLTKEHKKPRPKPISEVVPIPLDPGYPKQTVQIGKDRDPTIRDGIAKLLQQYRDVFVFELSEMPGIAFDIIEHKQCMDPSHRSVIWK